jgi:hypothetical protein
MDVDEKTEELLLGDTLLNEINSNLNLYSVLGSGTNNNFSQIVNFKVDNTDEKMEIDTGAIVNACTERSFQEHFSNKRLQKVNNLPLAVANGASGDKALIAK